MKYDADRSFGSYCFVEDSVGAGGGGQPLDSPVGQAIAYESLRRHFGGLSDERIRAAVDEMTSPNWAAGLPIVGTVAVHGAKPTGLA